MYLATHYPDELEADFWHAYRMSWRDMPLWRAAVLAVPLAQRPDYDTCRAIDPHWWWRDPLTALVSSALGNKPPSSREMLRNKRSEKKRDGEYEAVTAQQALALLAAPRTPITHDTVKGGGLDG